MSPSRGGVHPSSRSISREGTGSLLGPAPSQWCSARPWSRAQTGDRLRATWCAQRARPRSPQRLQVQSTLGAESRRAGVWVQGGCQRPGRRRRCRSSGAVGSCSRRRRGRGFRPWRASRLRSLRPGRTVQRDAAPAAGTPWSRSPPRMPSCSP